MFRTGSKWTGRAGLLFGAALLAGSLAVSAFAHSRPLTVSPGDGAVLATAPSQITMDTSEEVSHNTEDNSLLLLSSTGAPVASGYSIDAAHQHLTLTVPVGLAVGVYTVRWVTTSAEDGDAATGTWSFTYDPSLAPSAGSAEPADHGSDVEPTDTPTETPTETATATPTTPAATATTPAATATTPAATATATKTVTAPAPPSTGTGPASSSSTSALWLGLSGVVVLVASGSVLYASRRR
jgi:methionine-rich copper-binding protein CopC